MLESFGLEVSNREGRGKCLISKQAMKVGTDFLIEAPLIAWMENKPTNEENSPAKIQEKHEENDPLLQDMAHWKEWQARMSPDSKVGLEAIGRTIAYVGRSFEQCRTRMRDEATKISSRANITGEHATTSTESEEEINQLLEQALAPINRLVEIPDGGTVTMQNTTPEELCAELKKGSLESALERICPSLPSILLMPHVVENICGRLLLNSIAIPRAKAPHVGVFVILSCMNHDCEPNVEIIMADSGDLSVTYIARRDIGPGEELCISYVPLGFDLAQRREVLKHWMFECDCVRCAREEMLGAVLDTYINGSSKSDKYLDKSDEKSSEVQEEVKKSARESLSLVSSSTTDDNANVSYPRMPAPAEGSDVKKGTSTEGSEGVSSSTTDGNGVPCVPTPAQKHDVQGRERKVGPLTKSLRLLAELNKREAQRAKIRSTVDEDTEHENERESKKMCVEKS